MRLTFGVFPLILLFLFACSGGGEEEKDQKEEKGTSKEDVKALQEEVMEVHDEVMPRMDEVQKWKREAKRKMDSLRKEGKDEAAKRMEGIDRNLGEAHDSMMRWMRQFEKPDPKNSEEAVRYLEKQKKKVKAMRDTMVNALDRAERELGGKE